MLLFGEPLKQNPDEDKATFVLSCTFDLRSKCCWANMINGKKW